MMERRSPRNQKLEATLPPPRGRYGIGQVSLAVLIFYIVVAMLDAKGLNSWAAKLQVSPFTTALKKLTEKHWERMANLGLEEPKFTLETKFLGMMDTHPLLYPRKYAEVVARREQNVRKKIEKLAAQKADPKYLEKKQAEREVRDLTAESAATGRPKVLVLGDSIMMTVGPVIKKDIMAKIGGAASVHAKLATGLARPDVYDWSQELRRLTARQKYDVIVMMLGTNDNQDFMEAGRILAYGTKDWVEAYSRRLANVMSLACQGASKVYWLGLPPMRSESFNRKVIRLNGLVRRQAAKQPCMQYVSTDQVLGDEKGNYTTYRKIADRLEKVRMIDGIHVTAKGGVLISVSLLRLLTTTGLASHH